MIERKFGLYPVKGMEISIKKIIVEENKISFNK